MIIVLKKKLLVTAGVLLAFAIACNVFYFGTSAPTSLPITNQVIMLDPGHGGEDGGAVGTAGTLEKEINLSIALKVQALLEQSGAAVIMTRAEDVSIHDVGEEKAGNRKISDLDNRIKMAGEYKPAAYVSIHMNTFTDSKYYGAQVFYNEKTQGAQNLATQIQNSINTNIENGNIRTVKEASGNIYILNDMPVPAVVVECGFLSNTEEEALLRSEDYQKRMAFAIYSGITKFLAQ